MSLLVNVEKCQKQNIEVKEGTQMIGADTMMILVVEMWSDSVTSEAAMSRLDPDRR